MNPFVTGFVKAAFDMDDDLLGGGSAREEVAAGRLRPAKRHEAALGGALLGGVVSLPVAAGGAAVGALTSSPGRRLRGAGLIGGLTLAAGTGAGALLGAARPQGFYRITEKGRAHDRAEAEKRFGKQAYDYAYEARHGATRAKSRQHDTPIGWRKSMGVGASVGAGIGALGGAFRGARRALVGAGIGAAGGAALGGLVSAVDAMDINEAKRIMEMRPKERREYLAAKAAERRRAGAERASEWRHAELVDAVRSERGK